MERFSLLFYEEKNRPLVEKANALILQAAQKFRTKSEQMEWVFSRLLSEMYVPSGDKNFYHSLIDGFGYTKIEYETFLRMLSYVASFRLVVEFAEDGEYRILYDIRDDYAFDHWNALSKKHPELKKVANSYHDSDFKGVLLLAQRMSPEENEFGLVMSYMMDNEAQERILESELEELANLPSNKLHQILNREFFAIHYELFGASLEPGSDISVYRKAGIDAYFKKTIWGPGIEVFIPLSIIRDYAEAVDEWMEDNLLSMLQRNLLETGMDI